MPARTKDLNPIEHVNIYDYNSVMATLKKHDFRLVTTGSIMRFPIIRKSMHLIKLFNNIEKLSTIMNRRKAGGIRVYAKNI